MAEHLDTVDLIPLADLWMEEDSKGTYIHFQALYSVH